VQLDSVIVDRVNLGRFCFQVPAGLTFAPAFFYFVAAQRNKFGFQKIV
jgi:hypothetical protein